LLLKNGFKVTLRPHPQTIKLANKKVQEIVNKHRANPLFHLEGKISSHKSLYESSLMISDWSGAALDYALGFKKPVLFIEVPKKINNIDYKEIGIEPLEVSIRSKIGTIISLDKLEDIKLIINELLEGYISQDYAQLSNNAVYNLHYADRVGAEELEKLINENVK
jgi:YidC/Oxa1 family membrane protein insertase